MSISSFVDSVELYRLRGEKYVKKGVKKERDIYDVNDTALKKHAKNGNLELVKYLVEQKGASIRAQDDYALRCSAENGYIDIVKYLAKKGANIHVMDNYALKKSAENGHLDLVKFLVGKGVDVNSGEGYALRKSAKNGHLEIVEYLVENGGANIHLTDNGALKESAESGRLEIVEYLVDNGANIHSEDNYALKMSAENGHLAMVKYLVKKKANIHVRNEYALRKSAENGHVEIVKHLIRRRADVHAVDDYALKKSAENGYLNIVEFLVDHGADIHAQNDYALRKSVSNNHISVIQYLIGIGANIYAVDNYALKTSAENGNFGLVKYLVKKGANIHAQDDYALIQSALGGHTRVVQYLIEYGADIREFTCEDLDIIGEYGYSDIVKTLLDVMESLKEDSELIDMKSVLYKFIRTCMFCLEDHFINNLEDKNFPIYNTSPLCDHEVPDICYNCLTKYIEVESAKCFDIVCPDVSCKCIIPFEFVKHHSDEKTFETYDNLLLKRVMNLEPDFRYCKSKDCNAAGMVGQIHESVNSPECDLIEKDPERDIVPHHNVVTCFACKSKSCFKHDLPFPCSTCDEENNVVKKNLDRIATEAFLLDRRNGMRCPTCNVHIYKIDGCANVYCTQCHQTFVYG